MSLHAYIPLPSLALAITPAPPPKLSKPKDDKEEKPENRDLKPADPNAKADPEKKVPEVGQVPKSGPADRAQAQGDEKENEKDKEKTLVDQAHPPDLNIAQPEDVKREADVPQTPITPMSMIPEPATPDPFAPIEMPVAPLAADKDARVDEKHKSEMQVKKDTEDELEAEPSPIPLRLIGPSPHIPIRTRLDINPAKPYPPIDTDPRGAYHHYARGFSSEWLLIDVVKDGWMFEYWRSKSERDALDRLRGEDVRRAERELEVLSRTRKGMREVPDTAGELLVQLWNDLAEAPWNELSVETFWERYDWTSDKGKLHSRPVPESEKKENNSVIVEGQELEWTKQGVEDILGTVGVQAVYNAEIPIGRRYTGSGRVGRDRAFLLLGHDHFMIRLKEWLVWKPQEGFGEFQILVASGHDRIFGEMVRAQRMQMKKKEEDEYKKRKIAEKEAIAIAKAKGEVKDGAEAGAEADADAGAKIKGEGEGKDEKKKEDDKVQDRLIVTPGTELEDEEAKVMIALPVKDLKDVPEGIKHEQEPHLVGPPIPVNVGVDRNADANANGEGKDEGAGKEKDAKDGDRDPNPIQLAENLLEGQKDLNMGDIKAAFKALEDAAGEVNPKDPKDPKDPKAEPKKEEEEQLIWTWAESCERWRWKNYEAGVQNLSDGGWEERDWKVFADGRGVEEFEDEEEEAEGVEIDIHDWSC